MKSWIETRIRQGWATLFLLAIYVAAFVAWQWIPASLVLPGGLAAAAGLLVLLHRAGRSGYFLTRVDQFLHAVVVLDLVLEAWLVSPQEGPGFLLCAAAFALVLLGYRSWKRAHPCACRFGLAGECPVPRARS